MTTAILLLLQTVSISITIAILHRNTPECIAWLKLLDTFQEQYDMKHAWNDQQCMIDHIEKLGDKLRIVPQRLINAYDYDQYPGSVSHMYTKKIFLATTDNGNQAIS
jgi:hypothetical protein